MVLKLFFRCSHNISFPDPEGAGQPEEKMEMKNTVLREPGTYKDKALSGESRTVMMEN